MFNSLFWLNATVSNQSIIPPTHQPTSNKLQQLQSRYIFERKIYLIFLNWWLLKDILDHACHCNKPWSRCKTFPICSVCSVVPFSFTTEDILYREEELVIKYPLWNQRHSWDLLLCSSKLKSVSLPSCTTGLLLLKKITSSSSVRNKKTNEADVKTIDSVICSNNKHFISFKLFLSNHRCFKFH